MNWKIFINDFFVDDIYTAEDVAGFVENGNITPQDYKDITKQEYEAPQTSTEN